MTIVEETFQDRADYFAQFWSKVEIGNPNACWEWRPSIESGWYGSFRGVPTHRQAYIFVHKILGKDAKVCHSCDNPPCCNPNHLWAGSQADNVRDMMEKGRGWSRGRPGGRKGGRPRKLTDAQVSNARKRYRACDITCMQLARESGVSRTTMYRMLMGARDIDVSH